MGTFLILIEFIADLFAIVIYSISSRIKKDQNLWIFGTWSGEAYNDNSKYLFEYVQKNHPEIRAVWLAKRTLPIQLVRKKGFEAYDMFSPYGIWLAMKAGYAICSVSIMYDFYLPALSKKTKYINLTHGLGPKNMTISKNQQVKTPGKMRVFCKKLSLFVAKIVCPYMDRVHVLLQHERWEDYYVITALSETAKKKIVNSHQISGNNIVSTGYPRNSILLDPKPPPVPITSLIHRLKKHNIKIGLYAPTYRKEGKVNIVDEFISSADELGLKLEKAGIYLFAKLHNWDRNDAKNTNAKLRHIHILSEEDIDQDIYPLLSLTDFLITDYSSIYTDYLLLDKPIIFAVFDKSEYEAKDRGFYFDYEKATPGPKAYSWKDLYNQIFKTLQNPDKYKSAREHSKKFFHDFEDEKSTERVMKRMRIFSL